MADDDDDVGEVTSRLIAVTAENIYTNSLLDRKKLVSVAWLLPGDPNCDPVSTALRAFSGEPTCDNITILVLNPERFPQLAAQLELSAVPAFQLYWRGTRLASFTASNMQKITAHMQKALSVRNNDVAEELKWSRNAPSITNPQKGEKITLLDQYNDLGVARVGVGWKVAKGTAPPSVSLWGICLRDNGKISALTDILRAPDNTHTPNQAVAFRGKGTRTAPPPLNNAGEGGGGGRASPPPPEQGNGNEGNTEEDESDNFVFDMVLDDIDPSIKEVVYALVVEDLGQGHSVNTLKSAYIRVYDREAGQCVSKFEATPAEGDDEGDAGAGGEDEEGGGAGQPPMVLLTGKVYRTAGGRWKFHALGEALSVTADQLEQMYVEKKKEKKKAKPKPKQEE